MSLINGYGYHFLTEPQLIASYKLTRNELRHMKQLSESFILSINCGSSSLKFSLYRALSLKMELQGSIKNIGSENGIFSICDSKQSVLQDERACFPNLGAAVAEIVTWFKNNHHKYRVVAIGHRVIQGGAEHRAPELITSDLLEILSQQIYLAPNHLPAEINTIAAFKAAFKDAVQVACFDTLFHRNMPVYAKRYPLPAEFINKGLAKYGFHGLSYEYIMKKLTVKIPATKRRKIIIAHLGNGASMVAVKNGMGVDTTMGISPMGGLVMGTRPGDLDPGAILFLLKEGNLSYGELDQLLSEQSGLKALAGTNDVQRLLTDEAKDPKAKDALTLFCYTAKKFIGALASAMGGLDILVFTGGIGENSPVIRERICEDMEFLGIELHQPSNHHNNEIISSAQGTVQVRVLATDEEWMIAHHSRNFIDNN